MVEKRNLAKKLGALAVTGAAAVSGLTSQAEAGMVVLPTLDKETQVQSTTAQKVQAIDKAVDVVRICASRGSLPKKHAENVAEVISNNKDALNMPNTNGELPLYRVLTGKSLSAEYEQGTAKTVAAVARFMISQGAKLDAVMEQGGAKQTVREAVEKTNPQALKALDTLMQKDVVAYRAKSVVER